MQPVIYTLVVQRQEHADSAQPRCTSEGVVSHGHETTLTQWLLSTLNCMLYMVGITEGKRHAQQEKSRQ